MINIRISLSKSPRRMKPKPRKLKTLSKPKGERSLPPAEPLKRRAKM